MGGSRWMETGEWDRRATQTLQAGALQWFHNPALELETICLTNKIRVGNKRMPVGDANRLCDIYCFALNQRP